MDHTLWYMLVLLLKAIVWAVELVTDFLLGYTYTAGSRRERELAASVYEKSAQLVTIKARGHQHIFLPCSLWNFIYKHEEFVSPEIVINDPQATLFIVTPTYAVFCITPPEVNVNDVIKYPFTCAGQQAEAKQLIIMPTQSFHQLADKVGDPKVKVGLVAMTARCGSTLLAQMMHRVPKVRCSAENYATVTIHNEFVRGRITPEENRRLIQSAIRLQCKVEPGEDVTHVFMKLTVLNAPQFKIIKELFPQIHLFFNTRHLLPTVKSTIKCWEFFSGSIFCKTKGHLRHLLWYPYIPYDGMGDEHCALLAETTSWRQDMTLLEVAVASYSQVFLNYLKCPDIYDQVILYEDFMEDPHVELGKLFDVLKIDHKHIPLALTALDRDSQNGLIGERAKCRSHIFSDRDLQDINRVLSLASLDMLHDIAWEDFKKIFEGKTVL